jgi:2-desacetyl-2-hydroxyethyl bacteriochlorophyllide A dehydrogenase
MLCGDTMKAVRYVAPWEVRTVEVALPVPAEGEALVKVRYCGICGSDMGIIGGTHPRAKPPLILGHEFAGEIVELRPDENKTTFKSGDHVTAYPLLSCGKCWSCRNGVSHVCRSLKLFGIDRDGFMAEFAAVPVKYLYKLPETQSYEKAALVEPLAVGVHSVAMAQVQKDDMTVVMGAGPIGLVVALSLRDAGVKKIYLTDINAYRLELARQLGFATFNAAEGKVTEEILRITDGNGADVVFEVAGAAPSAMQMTELVRCRGKVIMVSVHKAPHEVDLRSINFKEITLIGTRVYTRPDYEHAIKIAGDLPLEKLVTHKIPIADAPRGFELMKNPDGVCKVLISME